jgi:hypothetical protein
MPVILSWIALSLLDMICLMLASHDTLDWNPENVMKLEDMDLGG